MALVSGGIVNESRFTTTLGSVTICIGSETFVIEKASSYYESLNTFLRIWIVVTILGTFTYSFPGVHDTFFGYDFFTRNQINAFCFKTLTCCDTFFTNGFILKTPTIDFDRVVWFTNTFLGNRITDGHETSITSRFRILFIVTG